MYHFPAELPISHPKLIRITIAAVSAPKAPQTLDIRDNSASSAIFREKSFSLRVCEGDGGDEVVDLAHL